MSNKLVKLLVQAIFIFAANCYAADFNASVSSVYGNVGQGVTLILKLVDADPKENPDFSPLLQSFVVTAQQKFSSTKIINGHRSTETTWHLNILPKRNGKINIPRISIKTKQGIFSTEPLEIDVAASNKQLTQSEQDISITTEVSKTKTYLREPVIYTIKIISDLPWTSGSVPEITSEGALVEIASGWPKQYKQMHGNRYATITEIKYFITPVNSGEVELSAPRLEGEIQSARGMLGGYYDLHPFAIHGKTMILNVLEPPIAAKDWLPLQDLNVHENWSDLDNIKVGDTITRNITLVATGGFSSQITDMKSLQEDPRLKVYVNKTENLDDLDPKSNTILSTRKEEFSLVPKEAGIIYLPEIKIPWWNLRTKQLEYATLPEKRISVSQGVAEEQVAIQDFAADLGKVRDWSYVLIFILGILSAVLIGWATPKFFRKLLAKTPSLPEDASGLKQYILEYAIKYWSAPANINLQELPEYLITKGYSFDFAAYDLLNKNLNKKLYAHRTVTFDDLMSQWINFRKSVAKQSRIKSKKTENTRINPT